MVSYIADEDIPFVGSDHRLGAYMATEYLIKSGYEKIGYINGEKGNLLGDLRRCGYEEALKSHGRRIDKRLVYHLRMKGEWHDYESGYEIGKKFRGLETKPDALFIYNDLAALGFEDAVLAQGLRIPEDIAVVGFDDIERGEYATVPLTTVRQPTDSIGKQAVELLLRLMSGKASTIRRVVKPELVIRESSGGKKEQNSGRKSASQSGLKTQRIA
jgi:DNA-binding LacI/PurR family transcriptional regulator